MFTLVWSSQDCDCYLESEVNPNADQGFYIGNN